MPHPEGPESEKIDEFRQRVFDWARANMPETLAPWDAGLAVMAAGASMIAIVGQGFKDTPETRAIWGDWIVNSGNDWAKEAGVYAEHASDEAVDS